MQITQWSDALSGWLVGLGLPEWAAIFLVYAVGAFVLINYGMLSVLLLIWITRKVISRIQDRIGPNRVGKFGLLQTVADAAKLLSKEDITPREADKIAYNLSPILAVSGVLMLLAVVPFAPGLTGVDLNIAALYVVALGSIGIMAALMAGWGSNNKYALLAGFRVVAQLLSYEIPLVLAILTVVLLTGSMRFGNIVESQSLHLGGFNLGVGWLGIVMPGALLIFFISSLAEAELTPFDLLEAESELIAGFHIEYSGMKFAMFFLAQFLNAWILAAVMVTLFLGGWQGPGVGLPVVGPLLGLGYFMIKVYGVYVLQQWIRGTFPRMRIDQMMYFAWKVLVPLMIGLIVVQAIVQKLPTPVAVHYVLIFAANIGVLAIVAYILQKYFRQEQMRTKRSFEPTSLIGTMQVNEEGTMY
ncbi:MAG: NADH-quinone oxidoreductase subunit NuoH [Caldilineaceae bacterium]|nr:NADH-quinone oxidoreductase subunit NuoH [Caldilineaceae bacterium]MCY4116199.1 NADH-quinone oxidoreductase subunit NuoH [Caldilineaceae bacterium]MDE0429167.1 NADH-quinone oxidoreductase subunit NuoH [Caldilineaceae bacterium]